jgi:hypothetical protein
LANFLVLGVGDSKLNCIVLLTGLNASHDVLVDLDGHLDGVVGVCCDFTKRELDFFELSFHFLGRVA